MTQPPIGGATGSPGGSSDPQPPAGAMPPAEAFPPPPASGHPPYQNPAPPAPGYPPYQDPAPPTPGYPPHPNPAAPYQNPPAPKSRRGLLITLIVLAVTIVLCGVGGTGAFLALRNTEDGQGATEPAVAVDRFLTAVYRDQDATKAATFVCSAARDDKKIAAKVTEVQKYAEQYQKPQFRWTTPKVGDRTDDRATVTTKVTMTTVDEKVADQELRFIVVRKTGWWVCDVS